MDDLRIPGRGTATSGALLIAGLLVSAAIMFVATAWKQTNGDWPTSIDDSYIHAQYARHLCAGRLFCWSPGDPPSRGETSPLYCILLATGYLVGFRDHWIMAFAFGLNVMAVGAGMLLLYHMLTRRLGWVCGLLSVAAIVVSGPMVYAVCCGMETGLACGLTACTVWALDRAASSRPPDTGRLARYVICASALPLVRPEMILVVAVFSLCLAVTLVRRQAGIARVLSCLCAPAIPFACVLALQWFVTGRPLMASLDVHSVWKSPIHTFGGKWIWFTDNLSQAFFALHIEVFGALAWPAELVVAIVLCFSVAGIVRRRDWLTPGMSLVAAVVHLVFLCGQRSLFQLSHARYFQPTIVLLGVPLAYGVYVAALSFDWLRRNAAWRRRPERRPDAEPRRTLLVPVGSALVLSAAIVCLLPRLLKSRDEFAAECRSLSNYQVATGRYIAERNRREPGFCRRLFTNDAGAPIYFSGVRGFDLTGLCTEIPGYPLARAQAEHELLFFDRVRSTWAQNDLPDCSYLHGLFARNPMAGEKLFDALDASGQMTFVREAHMALYAFPRKSYSPSARDVPVTGALVLDTVEIGDIVDEDRHRLTMQSGDTHRVVRVELVATSSTGRLIYDAGRALNTTWSLTMATGNRDGEEVLVHALVASSAPTRIQAAAAAGVAEIPVPATGGQEIQLLRTRLDSNARGIDITLRPATTPYAVVAKLTLSRPPPTRP